MLLIMSIAATSVSSSEVRARPAWNRPIAPAIPGARFVELADAGHIPQYEQPGAFRSALLDWLAAT
jgi:pimeloyl-ACP methyl ester carboxylesterase